jgi:hypothetical protein
MSHLLFVATPPQQRPHENWRREQETARSWQKPQHWKQFPNAIETGALIDPSPIFAKTASSSIFRLASRPASQSAKGSGTG